MVRHEETPGRNRAEESWLAMADQDPAFFLAEADEAEIGREDESPYSDAAGGARRRVPSQEH